MSKRNSKAVVALMCISVLLLSAVFSLRADAGIKIPDEIRIGIFFKDTSSHNVNTAVASFRISAQKGLEIGFLDDDSFVTMYEESGSEEIIIRKDSYFINSNGSMKEYNGSDKAAGVDGLEGPYHIKIGQNFSSIKKAKSKASSYNKEGIDTFLVYTDKWQVWTGFYVDEETARKAMTSIKKKLDKEKLEIIGPSSNRVAAFSTDGKPVAVFESEKTFLRIRPAGKNKPCVLTVNGSGYRGQLEVRRYEDSDMTVINILPFEEYLYGVVPCEIGAASHPEALKAQAVAARTYALYNLGKHEKHGFDLCNTSWCQVYKGFSVETPASNKAVDDTKGEKVTYNGSIAQVYYFSSSGGRTESAENVWSASIPYLVSVEDKYESGKSWRYSWQTTVTVEEIKKIMQDRKCDIGDIIDVAVTKTSAAGRATELVIKGTKGQKIYTKAGCRSAFSFLYSQLYTIETDADMYVRGGAAAVKKMPLGGKTAVTGKGLKSLYTSKKGVYVAGAGGEKRLAPTIPTKYTFTGKGNGHGVGMSQEGAKGMANAGFTYKEILMHYFQGTKVE